MEEPRPRSSILYALGKLTAEREADRQTLQELPQRLADHLKPLYTDVADHGRRIGRLEKAQWLWMGGGTVILVITGYVVQLVSGK